MRQLKAFINKDVLKRMRHNGNSAYRDKLFLICPAFDDAEDSGDKEVERIISSNTCIDDRHIDHYILDYEELMKVIKYFKDADTEIFVCTDHDKDWIKSNLEDGMINYIAEYTPDELRKELAKR